MENKSTFNLQAMPVEFKHGPITDKFEEDVQILTALCMRAMEELGLLRKSKRKPSRIYNSQRRRSSLGVEYGK